MLFVRRGFEDQANAQPYSVHYRPSQASAERPPGVAKLEEGRFHVWRSGALGTFLPTASAILVSRGFASALDAETKAGWRIREITILDPPNGEIAGYVELVVDDEIGPHTLPRDVSGKRVWRYRLNSLFVSPELANVLSPLFPDLGFSLGLWVAG
jgi:hypothetical protein